MSSICESCRFGYPEPNEAGYYCEAKDEVFSVRSQCGCWACKLSRIGTPLEYEHCLTESLERLALSKDMSLRDLAKKVNVSEVQMWRYANRKRVPPIPIASAIADALGIDWKEVEELCEPMKEE